MARVTMTEDLASRIASAYAESGFGSKSDAMVKAGLDPAYSKSGCGYKMFQNKMVQEAIKAIIDGSPAADEISIDSIIEALAKLAYPPDGVDVSDANRINALDKLAKIRQAYRDGAGDTEKACEVLERMSQEEIETRRLIAKIRCTEIAGLGGDEKKLKVLLEAHPDVLEPQGETAI